jgi:hypothetical protein
MHSLLGFKISTKFSHVQKNIFPFFDGKSLKRARGLASARILDENSRFFS